MAKKKKPNWYHGYAYDLETSDKRRKKFMKQIKKRGFDDTETWNMDFTISSFILPRLKRFKKINNGYPSELTEKEWNKIIDKMILSLEIKLDDDTVWETDKEKTNQLNEGFDLLRKYFIGLWW